jgi:deoxyribodipyrimidine photo-lyase
MNEMEQQFYNCIIGKDYPTPIVNINETRKKATDIVWSFRKKDEVKLEGKRIYKNTSIIQIGNQSQNSI